MIDFLVGCTRLELTGATPQWGLNRLAAERIPFWDTVWIDAVTVRLTVRNRDRDKAESALLRAMCTVRQLQQDGLLLRLQPLRKRPVLLLSGLAALMLIIYLSHFVLFYSVSGNEAVPSEQIIRELRTLGIDTGIYGPNIKPKVIKDQILNRIPQLQWITVTQNGCRANVIVRERPEEPASVDRKTFGNLVASKSGVITEQSVYSGTALFSVGDAVLKGDLLVTGAVDLERVTMLRNAIAEVFALTVSEQTVVLPQEFGQKHYLEGESRCFWLTFGQKRIKIFGNSGISTTNCDKMIETIPLTLPQGLQLPVSLTIETFSPYALQTGVLSEPAAQLLLSDYAEQKAAASMLAGEILDARHSLYTHNGCYVLHAVLQCREMIALPMEADWIKEDWDHDGTYSERGTGGTDH